MTTIITKEQFDRIVQLRRNAEDTLKLIHSKDVTYTPSEEDEIDESFYDGYWDDDDSLIEYLSWYDNSNDDLCLGCTICTSENEDLIDEDDEDDEEYMENLFWAEDFNNWKEFVRAICKEGRDILSSKISKYINTYMYTKVTPSSVAAVKAAYAKGY